MEFLRRHRFALGFALVLCLALLGRWAILQQDVADAPASVEKLAANDAPHEEAQPPPAVEAVASPAPNAQPAPPPGVLRGQVIDAVTRKPVREFELKFQDVQRGYAATETRTFQSQDGRFEWRRAVPGEWILVANARGYQRFELNGSQVAGSKTAPEMVLPLRPGRKLRGRVYDEITRIGIAAANISFRDANVGRFEGNWRSRTDTTSRKDGSFVLDGVPPGRITLEVGAQAYAGRELDVFVDKESAPLEIGLSSGGTIAGRLTAADGVTPVAGSAGLFNLDKGFGGSSATGETGEFSYQHLAAGRYRLTGQAAGATVTRDIVLADNERVEGIVLALGEGHSIRGNVTGLRPEVLRRVTISLLRDEGLLTLTDNGVDERGAFVLNGVAPGRVTLIVGASSRRQLSKTIDMPSDTDLTVNFDFPSGARLLGRVTRGGKPLVGVEVQPRPVVKQDIYVYGTATAGNGEYVIEDLAAGEYTLLVGSYASRPVQVSGDTTFDVDVPLVSLSGRVLEAASQVPVVEADVDIRSAAQSGSPPMRMGSRSDHFGQFSFAGLEPGDFILTAYKPGYEMVRQRISYSAPTSGITISLRQSRGVEITVREAGSGKSLRHVEVTEVAGDGNASALRLRLDENGVGYIPEALTGSTLSFSASGYAPSVIRGWNGQDLDLHLSRKPQ